MTGIHNILSYISSKLHSCALQLSKHWIIHRYWCFFFLFFFWSVNIRNSIVIYNKPVIINDNYCISESHHILMWYNEMNKLSALLFSCAVLTKHSCHVKRAECLLEFKEHLHFWLFLVKVFDSIYLDTMSL